MYYYNHKKESLSTWTRPKEQEAKEAKQEAKQEQEQEEGQVQGQGHRIDNAANQVVVDRASHWNEWTFADGTVDLSTPGVVKPRRWARNTNAMLNIVQFLHLM